MESKIQFYEMMYGNLTQEQLMRVEDGFFSRDVKVSVQDIVGRVYACLIELKRMVLDRTANESYYTREQIEVIDEVCSEIVEDLQDMNIEVAIDRLMCLQLLTNIQITLVSRIRRLLERAIQLGDYIDTTKYFGHSNEDGIDFRRHI